MVFEPEVPASFEDDLSCYGVEISYLDRNGRRQFLKLDGMDTAHVVCVPYIQVCQWIGTETDPLDERRTLRRFREMKIPLWDVISVQAEGHPEDDADDPLLRQWSGNLLGKLARYLW